MKDVFYGWVDTVKPIVAERLGSVVCYGDGKGGFEMQDLPLELQLAPIFSFQKIQLPGSGKNIYLSAGNFFDVIPYEGRYDAQPLASFNFTNNKLHYVPQSSLAGAKGQFRDLKLIRTANNKNLLLAARNNESLLSFVWKPDDQSIKSR